MLLDEIILKQSQAWVYYSVLRCFCTERRLDLLRREAARARQPMRYDRRCAELTEQEIADKV